MASPTVNETPVWASRREYTRSGDRALQGAGTGVGEPVRAEVEQLGVQPVADRQLHLGRRAGGQAVLEPQLYPAEHQRDEGPQQQRRLAGEVAAGEHVGKYPCDQYGGGDVQPGDCKAEGGHPAERAQVGTGQPEEASQRPHGGPVGVTGRPKPRSGA